MKVKDFVEQFVKTTDKERFVAKHIKTSYIPYAVKMNEAARIVRTSTYTGEEGAFKLSSPTRYLLFILTVLQQYTDIELNLSAVTEDFDALDEVGAIDFIVAAIGRDVDTFQTIVNMTYDDELTNTRDLVPFLETKIEALGAVLSEIIAAAEAEQQVQ